MDVFAQLAETIVEKAPKVDSQKITREATLGALGVDSLAEVEIAQALERRLGFPVDDSHFVSRNTLGEIEGYLRRQEAAHLPKQGH
ncbi:acyl carrier protein [Streptomyces shenzhenensis]|uniref:Carrier domain-containing protein n=1 Tax=Streptomyces shenzhenensis TaxID=943815 RepID=A0A3M0HWQ2_9ACTN|nr:acyl carrier protein [Streptomyces shenzhenensis]RMB80558.1 hypothetical protein CTZ28_39120 [Streptomyces shenzhenensis]